MFKISLFLLFVMTAITLKTFDADAGDWRYGCIGTLPDGQKIVFNRSELIISSEQITAKNFLSLTYDDLRSFDTTDINSGFQDEMTFQHVWSDQNTETLKLKQISSINVASRGESVSCSRFRARDITHETTRKTYDVYLPCAEKPERTTLQCYEYIVTSCG